VKLVVVIIFKQERCAFSAQFTMHSANITQSSGNLKRILLCLFKTFKSGLNKGLSNAGETKEIQRQSNFHVTFKILIHQNSTI